MKEFKFDLRNEKPGQYSLSIYLISDCYYGLDIETSVKYEVKPPRKHHEEEVDKHEGEEDQSFFSKMMQQIIPSQ